MGVVRQRLSFSFIQVVIFFLASFNHLLLAIVNYKLYICRVIKNIMYMIRKNVKIGNQENVTLVDFGVGDMLIGGIDWNDENIHGVFFSQDIPKEIEQWENVEKPITTLDDSINPVIIRFSNIESVQQLIKSLSEVIDSFN